VSARAQLLERCHEWLEVNGLRPHSLRQIAAGVGTSHRMLIYHFGTHEQLLAEIVGRVEANTRRVLAELTDTDDPSQASLRFWRYLSDPDLAAAERLFFEIYADALHGRPWTDAFRASVVTATEDPVAEAFAGLGFDPEQARIRARLAMATTRGLLLDLLLTGDRELLTRASGLFGELIVSAGPGSDRARP
jgi:AcrR family transcriptional regulator